MRRFTQHSGDSLRFATDSASGLLEARITPEWAFLVYHQPDCDGDSCGDECDAEVTPGMALAALWRAAGCNDDEIWRELARRVGTEV